MVTVGAIGAAATKVGRSEFLPTGVFGFSNDAGTDVGAFPDLATGLAEASGGGTAFVMDLGDTFGVTFGGADFVVVLFDVTFGGAFESLEGVGLDDLATAFGAGLALAPFAVTLAALAGCFGAGFALAAALTVLAVAAVLGLAVFAFALATAFPLAAGLAGTFFLTALMVLVTFVDFPLTLPLVAVLAFFAVANLISSAVFLLFSLPPVAGGGISKTRKSTETIGQKQRIVG